MREVSLSDINVELVPLKSWLELVRPTETDAVARMERVRQLMRVIPPIERDVIELHFFAGKSQEQIGAVLDLTQQAVSHRLRRAVTRLAFLLEHPRLAVWEVRRDVGRVWPDAPVLMAPVLAEFARTSSQTETAKRLGVPQQLVRRYLATASLYFSEFRLPRGVESQIARRYATMLSRLLANRSILCEVPVPRRPYERPVPSRRAAACGRGGAAQQVAAL